MQGGAGDLPVGRWYQQEEVVSAGDQLQPAPSGGGRVVVVMVVTEGPPEQEIHRISPCLCCLSRAMAAPAWWASVPRDLLVPHCPGPFSGVGAAVS